MDHIKLENVVNVSINVSNSVRTCFSIPVIQENPSPQGTYYFFETPYHDAFFHWIYESAIHLLDFPEEKQLIIIKNPERKYKKLFLSALGIREDQIRYINHITCPFPLPNKCFVSQKPCTNQKDAKYLKEHREQILKFRDYFDQKAEKTKKNIGHLFFPRNKTQNYIGNDRKLDYEKVWKQLEGEEYMVYDTMETEDIFNQINLLKKAINIYLDYGSSLLVNGLFCEGSNIYVTGSPGNQPHEYPYLGEVYKIIKEKNNILFL